MNNQPPLTEEEYQQLLQLGAANQEMDPQISQQMAIAEMMRNAPAPQMRNPRGIPVAPGWGEALGNIAQQGVGHYAAGQAKTKQEAQAKNQAAQNQMILKALMQQNQPMQQPAGPGFMPPQDPRNPY